MRQCCWLTFRAGRSAHSDNSGPTVLSVGAAGDCLDVFRADGDCLDIFLSPFIPLIFLTLSLSLGDGPK